MTTLETPIGYQAHNSDSLKWYIAGHDSISSRLGGGADDWSVEDVGDGNINLVFIVRGPKGGVAIKQALPYVRIIGESWPLPLSRAHFEHLALESDARYAPGLVPDVIHYDETLALIVMEFLEPHIILRQGMIKGIVYPDFVEAITTYMAKTLYHTSDLAMTAEQKKAMVSAFAGNNAMCKITEDLIFTEPYMVADNNRWTTPELDPFAKAIREDGDLKIAISRLKLKFLSSAEALLHGDLHTGSVMLTKTNTRVIDPEFAFVGPMGFDIGAIIGNLLINYFSQIGHEDSPGGRDDYRDWILQSLNDLWTGFRTKFRAEWDLHPTGVAYPAVLFSDAEGALRLAGEKEAYLDRLFADAIGFAAAKMIRRIVGLAHNIDLEWIEDTGVRAMAEARALTLARDMMVNTDSYRTIDSVTAAARRQNAWQPELGN